MHSVTTLYINTGSGGHQALLAVDEPLCSACKQCKHGGQTHALQGAARVHGPTCRAGQCGSGAQGLLLTATNTTVTCRFSAAAACCLKRTCLHNGWVGRHNTVQAQLPGHSRPARVSVCGQFRAGMHQWHTACMHASTAAIEAGREQEQKQLGKQCMPPPHPTPPFP